MVYDSFFYILYPFIYIERNVHIFPSFKKLLIFYYLTKMCGLIGYVIY